MQPLTLTELKGAKKRALRALTKEAGTAYHLAKMLSVDPNVVNGWISRGQISRKGVFLVEDHPTLKVNNSRHNLRPDIHGQTPTIIGRI